MIGWSALLLAAIVYGGVQIGHQLSNRSTLGRADDFPPGSVTPFELRSTFEDPDPADPADPLLSPVPIYLVHDPQAGFLALLQRDPGSGCNVEWKVEREQFEDPCAGSVYDLRGGWVSGPSRRGLDRLRVLRAGRNKLQVDVNLFQIGPAAP